MDKEHKLVIIDPKGNRHIAKDCYIELIIEDGSRMKSSQLYDAIRPGMKLVPTSPEDIPDVIAYIEEDIVDPDTWVDRLWADAQHVVVAGPLTPEQKKELSERHTVRLPTVRLDTLFALNEPNVRDKTDKEYWQHKYEASQKVAERTIKELGALKGWKVKPIVELAKKLVELEKRSWEIRKEADSWEKEMERRANLDNNRYVFLKTLIELDEAITSWEKEGCINNYWEVEEEQ